MVFFPSSSSFRKWLASNHDKARELILGFYKTSSGRKGITYAEALDEALCFGWIDGVRRSRDATSYSIRFSPRKTRSIWSRVNLRHVERLRQLGRMMPAGLQVHAARDPSREGIYAFENAPRQMAPEEEAVFQADAGAWAFFQAQAAGYRRTAIWWVISAKKAETKKKRLAGLIRDSTEGKRLAQFTSVKRSPAAPPAA